MLNVSPSKNQELTQEQIYQDLSQIIKIFKSLLSILDSTASNIYRLQDSEQSIQQLRQSLRSIQGFIKFYNFNLSNESDHRNTFHRFICRIMEVVAAYKLRFQVVPYSSIVNSCIKQIEKSVLQYQNQKNIGQILRKIQISLLKFCSSKEKKKLKPQLSNNFNQRKYQYYSLSQFNEQGNTVNNNNNNNDFQTINLTIHEAKLKPIGISKSQSHLNKLILHLNKKYRFLNSLDLDFNYFKQSFFQSKDNKQQLYQQCFQRNQFIYREIVSYSKSFSQYLKRKQQKKSYFRKNKFLEPNSNRKRQSDKQSYLNFTKKKASLDSRQSFYKPNLDPLNLKVQKKHTLKNFSQIIHSEIKEPVKDQSTQKLPQDRLFIQRIVFTDTYKNFDLQNEMQLSKRKKNLQLKKIDISLSAHGQAQSAKLNNSKYGNKKNIQSMRRTNIFYPSLSVGVGISTGLTQQKKEEFQFQQKEEIQFKSKLGQVFQIDDQTQKNSIVQQLRLRSPITPMTPQRRKYMIKTSSKKSSIQQTKQKKQNGLINVKNFKRLKMEQIQKLQSLGKQLCAIRSIKIPIKQY